MAATLSDRIRIVLVVTGAVAQIVMGALPQVQGWAETIASRSQATETPVVPAGYAFTIWGVIFLGCLIYAGIQALPQNQTDPSFRSVGWLAAMAFWANTAWEYHVPLNGLDGFSVVLIYASWIPLLAAMFRFRATEERRWPFAPLMLMAGWVSVATFANMSTVTRATGFDPMGLGLEEQSMVFITVAGVLTAYLAGRFNRIPYTLATSWGLIAIFVANAAKGMPDLAYLALGAGIAGIAVLGFKRIIDATNSGGPPEEAS